MNNLLTNIPHSTAAEFFEELLQGSAFRAERIVSQGHVTPPNEWYRQNTAEWVLLLSGAARLRFQEPDQICDMRPGDFLNIPAQRAHRVEWTDPSSPTVWLAIHYQPA